VVAQGAAIAAAQMAKQDGRKVYSLAGTEIRSLPGGTFKNAAAHALGCAAFRRDDDLREFAPIIRKNTPLPAACSEKFALREANQTEARIEIYQGQEGQPLEECLHIDDVALSGIPAGPASEERIDVRYEYSRSGIVKVTVTDLKSGKSQVGEVAHQLGLSDEDVANAASRLTENQR